MVGTESSLLSYGEIVLNEREELLEFERFDNYSCVESGPEGYDDL